MMDPKNIDFSRYDRPEILQVLFYPRPELPGIFGGGGGGGLDVMIPVETDIAIGGRFHSHAKDDPTILFFHGNGEIVADYDEMGPIYNRLGINFFPVDYRGYGRSGGQPSITSMMQDCHKILGYVESWLPENGYTGPLLLMGRSLGSASVLELAATYPEKVAGLIIESGFALAGPLLQLLGINPASLGFTEESSFNHLAKIKSWSKPLLIIHAEFDHIIPFSDGQTLYDACPAKDKTLLKIAGANHNDIFFRGFEQYLAALGNFVGKVKSGLIIMVKKLQDKSCGCLPGGSLFLIKQGVRAEDVGKVAETPPLGNRSFQPLGHIKLGSGGVKDDTVDIARIGNDRVAEYLLGFHDVQSPGAQKFLQAPVPQQTIILRKAERIERR